MFHLVFSGPEAAPDELVDALTAAGYPAQVCTDRAGFPAEALTGWVEAIAGTDDHDMLAELVALAATHRYQLRLHSPVSEPRLGGRLLEADRIAELEARIAALEGIR